MDDLLAQMEQRWPSAIVARSEIGKFSGGALSPGHMANMDCLGQGPQGRVRVGKRVCYPVKSLVQWLEQRSKVLPAKAAQEFGEL